MATLDASIWLLLKHQSDPEVIHEKFTSFYSLDKQLDFLWLYLYYATQADHRELVKSILDHKCPDIKAISHVLDKSTMATCLNEAVRKTNVEMMRIFLDRHLDLCVTVGNLHVAETRFRMLYSPIELAIHYENIAALEILMEYYAGQVIGPSERTPLHIASKYPSAKSLKLLLSNEKSLAGINTKDVDDGTPLLIAAVHHPEAIPALLQHGADVSARRKKSGNALQILSNWSIKGQSSKPSEDDPCPTLGRAPRMMNTANEIVYVPDDFVALARALVERGIDVNAQAPDPPLRIFAKNVERRLGDVRGNTKVYDIFKDSMAYLALVSGQHVRDGALLDLCYLVNFVGTQLRRSHDYDNISAYIELLPFVRDLIVSLLYKGANADIKLAADTGEKKIRSLQYILPFTHPCASPLKTLISAEFTNQAESDRFNSPIDIALIAVINMYVLQVEEPELHTRAMLTVKDIIAVLSKSGARCAQTIHFFVCLSIDPRVIVPILHEYLDCLSQEQYHGLLRRMLDYISSMPAEQSAHFVDIKNELVTCQNRLYSLKRLLRRDIVALIGGKLQTEHIDQLPLPSALKAYLETFWD